MMQSIICLTIPIPRNGRVRSSAVFRFLMTVIVSDASIANICFLLLLTVSQDDVRTAR